MASGSWFGDLGEFLGFNNDFSSAGKARSAANQQNAFQQQMANSAMQFSADQAQKQMNFQEMMSNTAVQRRMADLKAAGINPILAAGSQASSPSGAMGSGVSASGAKADVDVSSSAKSVLGLVMSALGVAKFLR